MGLHNSHCNLCLLKRHHLLHAFKVWGKDTYTRRLTTIVQAERPDVVLSNHSPEQGHGHHRASIIAMRELLANEAKNGWVVRSAWVWCPKTPASPPFPKRPATGTIWPRRIRPIGRA